MGALSLRGVGKAHPGGQIAVADVDLDVADGELMVLVGPSGCGKTTLLRMIAGLDDPTAGEIVDDGESVGGVATNRRDLAMLFQSSALYPHMTVRENLAFPLKMAKVPYRETDRAVGEVASMLGLSDVLDRRPRRLSGGQQQRVAMGRAIIRRPSLLLMDEPMSNLDAKLRTDLRAELHALQRHLGVTTVYVTHDQVEAMALGDRAAVMRAGRIVQCAPPMELYERPLDVFVAGFIGMPPMNVLAARVVRDENGRGATLAVGSQRWLDGPVRARWPELDGQVGATVAVGFRPEAVALVHHQDVDAALDVEIRTSDWLGADHYVSASLMAHAVVQHGERPVVADEPVSTVVAAIPNDVEPDLWRRAIFAVDVSQLHLFELDRGRRLEPVGDRVSRRRTPAGTSPGP